MDRTGMDRERRTNLLIVVVVLAAVVAIPYAVVKTDAIGALLDAAWSDPDVDCGDFGFDRTAWLDVDGDGRRKQALGLDRCDALVGLRRADVAAMLDGENSRHPNRDRWAYFAGETNDYLGPGDGDTLNVYFGGDGTVRGTGLSLPLD